MGAVVNLRPDLFKAVVAEVPFVDVINTMLDASLPLTTGRVRGMGQSARQGSSSTTCCPTHPTTTSSAKAYPAMLVETSLNDSQVMYWEFGQVRGKAARDQDGRQSCAAQDQHGRGPRRRVRPLRLPAEIAFTYSFILWQNGLAS